MKSWDRMRSPRERIRPTFRGLEEKEGAGKAEWRAAATETGRWYEILRKYWG